MPRPVHLQHAEDFPVGLDHAYAATITAPLEQVFRRRFLAIPPITSTSGFAAPWGTPGQSRTIRMSDGGSMHETLTEATAPSRFAYRIEQITGPLKPLVSGADGAWEFAGTTPGSTRITWSWVLRPTALGAPLMPVFGRLWQGYAARGFGELRRLLG